MQKYCQRKVSFSSTDYTVKNNYCERNVQKASWSADKDTPELKSSLDTIRNAASDLIEKIEEGIQSKNNLVEMKKLITEHSDELPFR